MRIFAAAVLVGSLPIAGFGQAATAPPTLGDEPGIADDEPITLAPFVVLGTHIKRIDYETPQPVVRITGTEMRENGFTNLGEALRALPINTGAVLSPDGAATNHVLGMASVNLRGLGENETLVLINGRRAVPSGIGDGESVIDFNSIPQEAIASVEVLRDGASAIYGSDAVSGVININLHRTYVGSTVAVGLGNTFGTDSFERSVDVILGVMSPRTSITLTAGYAARNAIAAADLAYSRTSDFRQDRSSEQRWETAPDPDHPDGPGVVVGVDYRSFPSFPGGWLAPQPAAPPIRYTFATPTADPNPASRVVASRATGAGYYDENRDGWIYPETHRRYLTFFARHDLSESLYAFTDLYYFNTRHRQQAWPQFGYGIMPVSSPFNPQGTRYAPTTAQPLTAYFRLGNAPFFVREPEYEFPRVVLGFGGNAGDAWTWESSVMWARGGVDESFEGLALTERVAQAIGGVTIDGQTLYANPFGPEDPRVTAYYTKPESPVLARYQTRQWDATAQGDLALLPAGPLRLAAGLEYRADETRRAGDDVFTTGETFLGVHPHYAVERDVISGYAEFSIPLDDDFELQAALRYEDYSLFAGELKPKLAARARVASWLMLRGSYTESYRTPDLRYYAGYHEFVSYGWDPKRSEPAPYYLVRHGVGDAEFNLDPEEAATTFLGVIVEPRGDRFNGLSLEAGWFRFDYRNQITHEEIPEYIIDNEDTLPGRVVRLPLTPEDAALGQTVGRIDHVIDDWFNVEGTTYEGVDLSLAWAREFTGLGRLRFSADASYVTTFDRTTAAFGAVSGFDARDWQPRLRWHASAGWNKGHLFSCLYVNSVGGYSFNDGYPPLESDLRVNAQIGFQGPFDTQFTVGVRNVFDTDPPRNIADPLGYTPGVHGWEPRFWSVRCARDF